MLTLRGPGHTRSCALRSRPFDARGRSRETRDPAGARIPEAHTHRSHSAPVNDAAMDCSKLVLMRTLLAAALQNSAHVRGGPGAAQPNARPATPHWRPRHAHTCTCWPSLHRVVALACTPLSCRRRQRQASTSNPCRRPSKHTASLSQAHCHAWLWGRLQWPGPVPLGQSPPFGAESKTGLARGPPAPPTVTVPPPATAPHANTRAFAQARACAHRHRNPSVVVCTPLPSSPSSHHVRPQRNRSQCVRSRPPNR